MSSNPHIENQHTEQPLSAEQILRPKSFDEYIGQKKIKENVRTMVTAAKQRGEPVDHMLFYGQAGLGKTTLAMIVADAMGSSLHTTTGPAIEKSADLAALLSSLEEGDVLFIDEIHRLHKSVEEVLYPAMETRTLHLVVGKGPTARMLSIDLSPFTLIGATTRIDMLTSPLRSRFGAVFRLDYYTHEDIEKIVERSARLLHIDIEQKAQQIIARASRFTPRTANRLLKRVRDVSQVLGEKVITQESALRALEMFDIDYLGLEDHDRKLLSIIEHKFNGGPVGIATLSAALGQDKKTIEEIYEPFLLKAGLLQRTPGGRVITDRARKHIE